MTRPAPAKDRRSKSSTLPTMRRSTAPMVIPDPPSSLGPIGSDLWTEVWASGHGVYQPTDSCVIERYCSLHERRHHLLELVEIEGWLTTGSTGQIVVHPAARMVGDLEGRLSNLEDRLGRNPEARLRLGITAVEHQSRLDAFLTEGGDA